MTEYSDNLLCRVCYLLVYERIVVKPEASESPPAELAAPSTRYADWALRNPLPCALAIQAALLFYRLDLLEPWGDEWFNLTTVPQPLSQLPSLVARASYPPLYYLLVHFWIQIPWPASLLTKMRALSAVWTLLATIILDRLWLTKLEPRVRLMVLAMWVLSPCLLLYSRMARYYTMVLALALLTIYAASRWIQRPQSPRWLLAYSCSAGALLYTHYLPGLVIMAAVWFVFMAKANLSPRWRLTLSAVPVLVVALLYLPWLSSLFGSVAVWRTSSPYQVNNLFIDQLVRIAYWFVSFSFGETISAVGIVLGAALTPAIGFALYHGMQPRPRWIPLIAVASLLGYIGVSRWTAFPFTPARVLFALPFFLILLAKGIDASRRGPIVFAGLLLIYICGDYNYFAKLGYLNKAYCSPYQEMASVIAHDSPASDTTLFVDGYSSVSEPLLNRLGKRVRVISLDDEQSAEREMQTVRLERSVWFWRHTHDTSPDKFVSRMEVQLAQGRSVRQYDYLPYSLPERWILRLVRGPGQPAYFYRLSEMKLMNASSSGTPPHPHGKR